MRGNHWRGSVALCFPGHVWDARGDTISADMKIVGLLLLLVFTSLAPDAQAGKSRVVAQAYWVDKDGRATLRDVVDAPFQEFDGSLTKGYSTSALWLRLRISGAPSLEPLASDRQAGFFAPDRTLRSQQSGRRPARQRPGCGTERHQSYWI